jgi:hypothetical protein
MKINLPIVLTAKDYHAFADMKEVLNSVLIEDETIKNKQPKPAVNFLELGCDLTGTYNAYFHDASQTPSSEDKLKALLKTRIGQYSTHEEVVEDLEQWADIDLAPVPTFIAITDLNLNNEFFKKPTGKKNKIK